MTEAKKLELCKEWHRLQDELEKAQNEDLPQTAACCEAKLAAIETQLGDVDPRGYEG